MVDQSTNRKSLRSSSQKPRTQSSQSFPTSQQSTRVTRSRSRDVIEAEREPLPSRKRRKFANDEENVVNSSAPEAGKRGARSKGPQGNTSKLIWLCRAKNGELFSLQIQLTMIQYTFGSTGIFSRLSGLLRLGF